MQSRRPSASVSWDPRKPGTLKYTGAGGETELSVVQRSIELPSEKGWGGNELISLTVSIVSERGRERGRERRETGERENRESEIRGGEREEREREKVFWGSETFQESPSVFNYKHLSQLISTTMQDKKNVQKSNSHIQYFTTTI